MTDLVWILDSERGTSLGNAGVSSSYILPKSDVVLEPEAVVGKRLWIVLRGHEDRLLLLIKIKKVERIIEGYYSGDYLFSPELNESIKLVASYSEAAKYSILETRGLMLGVSELPTRMVETLSSLVTRSVSTMLLPPDKRTLARIELPLVPHSPRRQAQSALRAVASGLTLDQVWANGNGNKLGAFSNYAFALLTERIGVNPTPGLLNALKEFDPISVIFLEEPQSVTPLTDTKKPLPPVVDTEFSEIEPGKIYAREFISLDSKFKGLEDALNKTEHAEKIHQAMLKDISEFLIGKGLTPYESGSIDLTYKSGDKKLNVFEIKSSNVDNLLSQAAKGAFQLACYINELTKEYDSLDARLILHETNNPELQEYAIEVLRRLGITVLIYDPAKPWPNRLQGLPV